MFMRLYARATNSYKRDLRRGYSRQWGSSGKRGRHAGLSGYEIGHIGTGTNGYIATRETLLDTIERIEDYFASRGGRGNRRWIAVYAGEQAGTGPDLEDLFIPTALVALY